MKEIIADVDFKEVYKSCSVFCEEIKSGSQARHVMTLACQAAINKRGVAVVIMPTNVSEEFVETGLPFRVYRPNPVITPSLEELHQIKKLINCNDKITIYAGIGAQHAHDEVVALAEKLKAPWYTLHVPKILLNMTTHTIWV